MGDVNILRREAGNATKAQLTQDEKRKKGFFSVLYQKKGIRRSNHFFPFFAESFSCFKPTHPLLFSYYSINSDLLNGVPAAAGEIPPSPSSPKPS